MNRRLFHASATFLAFAALAKPAWAVSPEEYEALLEKTKQEFMQTPERVNEDEDAIAVLSDYISLTEKLAKRAGPQSGLVYLKITSPKAPIVSKRTEGSPKAISAFEVPLADLKKAKSRYLAAKTPEAKIAAIGDIREALTGVKEH